MMKTITEGKLMSKQISLETYKQKVRERLMKTYNRTTQATDKLMRDYEQILPEYFALKLTPIEMACTMTMGY